MRIHRSAIFSILVVLFCVAVPQVQAQGKGTITVDPAFSEVVIEENAQQEKIEITYVNTSTKEITLELFPLDFKQQGDMGEISFVGQDASSYSYSLASFLSIENSLLVLAPNEKKSITVSISNREGLSPGGHYAAVVARLASDTKSDTTSLSPSLSSLILVRKTGGERFNLSLIDAGWPKNLSFSYPRTTRFLFQNEGNIHVIPYGTFLVKDLFGRVLYKGAVNPSSFRVMPEGRRYIPVDVKKISSSFPLSINEVTVEGRDSLNKVVYNHRGSFLYVHPGVVILLVLLPIFLIVVTVKRLRRERGKK